MGEFRERYSCSQEIPCRLRADGLCREDIHHEAYPRTDYRTTLEKKFRNYVLNKVLICRALHDDEHAQHIPPVKPSVASMKRSLEIE